MILPSLTEIAPHSQGGSEHALVYEVTGTSRVCHRPAAVLALGSLSHRSRTVAPAPQRGPRGSTTARSWGDGGNDPFPIPWLDKNGRHNQSPAPEQEPSNIFHFKGRVARCNDFTGMGTDNQGNRIGFGSPAPTSPSWVASMSRAGFLGPERSHTSD